MNEEKKAKRWERTNAANLWKLASTGGYYARVVVNGKEKWRSLKTKLSSVAKLRFADFDRGKPINGRRNLEAAAKATDTACLTFLAKHYRVRQPTMVLGQGGAGARRGRSCRVA